MTHQCPECGAQYSDPTDSCMLRFQQLLALDHSRREPWGSRHGQAFAAFALEHPSTHALSLDAAWDALYRIYHLNEAPGHVFATRRQRPHVFVPVSRPPRPTSAFQITIADLGDFTAATYPSQLDRWCRAALAGWARE